MEAGRDGQSDETLGMTACGDDDLESHIEAQVEAVLKEDAAR